MKASILQDFDSRTSAFAEVRALGLKTVLRLATISMLVWLIFSVGVVWLLVTDRKQAFESVVKSHQQDIADGTSRTFIESMDRGDLAGISNVKACWGKLGSEVPNCTSTASHDPPVIAIPIQLPLNTGSAHPPTVYADLSLAGPLGVSALMLLLLLLLGYAWLSGMRELYVKTTKAQKAFAQGIADAIQSGDHTIIQALPSELRPLSHALVDTLLALQKTENQKKIAEAEWKMASQVAHDIRNPLAALEVIIKSADVLPEAERLMVRSAVGDIRDIANQLLSKKTLTESEPISQPNPAFDELLAPLTESVVSLKRKQYREKNEILIEAEFAEEARSAFARIDPLEFRRLLSNLITNAVEAIKDPSGRVTVRTVVRQKRIYLTVDDTGQGIPQNELSQVGVRGETSKKGGSGFGVSHAKESLSLWGGDLQISSEEGKGTSVLMTLPRSEPPKWFLSRLPLFKGDVVVILDDDPSIHGVWKFRLSQLEVELVNFKNEQEMNTWINAHPDSLTTATFLMDYELRGAFKTGLDLIDCLGIAGRSILVTSRAEEDEIRERCEKSGIKLLPKSLAGFIPIEFKHERQKIDAVLIDDNEIVHQSWQVRAISDGKRVRLFKSAFAFFEKEDIIPKDTPICVDVDLGDERGTDQIPKLLDRGFTQLYITTGHAPERFKDIPGIKGVIDKKPIWVQSQSGK